MTRRRGDDGQAVVLVVGLFLVALAVAGFAIDVGRAFAERAALESRADEAARAAVSGFDPAELAADRVRLDPAAAEARARGVLARAGLDPTIDVTVVVADGRVTVTLRKKLGTPFLRLVGVDDLVVGAIGSAVPRAPTERRITRRARRSPPNHR